MLGNMDYNINFFIQSVKLIKNCNGNKEIFIGFVINFYKIIIIYLIIIFFFICLFFKDVKIYVKVFFGNVLEIFQLDYKCLNV